jgi:hypothetical protein
VTRWNEGGIQLVGKAASRRRRRPAPIGFNICVDEDVEKEQQEQEEKKSKQQSAWQKAPSSTSLRRRLEGPGRTAEEREARELFNNPLKNFLSNNNDNNNETNDTGTNNDRLGPPKEPTMAPPLPPTTVAAPTMAPPPVPSSMQSCNKSSTNNSASTTMQSFSSTGNLGYHDSLLKDTKSGEIMSFEERRAQKMAKNRMKRAAAAVTAVTAVAASVVVTTSNENNSSTNQSTTSRIATRRALGSAGAKSKRLPSKQQQRRSTMDLGNMQEMYKKFEEQEYDSEEDEQQTEQQQTKQQEEEHDQEQEHKHRQEDQNTFINSNKVTRKVLTFSNCSSKNGDVGSAIIKERKLTNDQSAQRAAGTPASSVIDGVNATRKLTFNTSIAAAVSQHESELIDSSDSDTSSDDEDQYQQLGASGKNKNVIGLNKDDMTCNLQAAMNELGDLFCSPGFKKKLGGLSPGTASERGNFGGLSPGTASERGRLGGLSPGTASERGRFGGLSPGTASERGNFGGLSPGTASERGNVGSTSTGFAIFQEEEQNDNIENSSGPGGPKFKHSHQRRSIHTVKPSSILSEMTTDQYPSASTLTIDDDDEDDEEVSFRQPTISNTTTSTTTSTTSVGFGIFEDTVALDMFDGAETKKEIEKETMHMARSSIAESKRARVQFTSSHGNNGHEDRRTTLDMLSGLDPLDMTNDDSLDNAVNSVHARRTTTALLQGGNFSDSEEDEEQEKDMQNATQTKGNTKQPTFSIFEEVFSEHEDIQKDRRATMLGARLDGISEGDGDDSGSASSKSGRTSTGSNEEEEHDCGRRTSMDSLQGVGDLSSICCEEDDDVSRRWSGISSTLELPNSTLGGGGFAIFTD